MNDARSRPHRRRALGLAAIGAWGLAAFAALDAGAVAVPDAVVRIEDFRFTPARVTVPVGARVEWVMGPDPEQHTVTPDVEGAFRESGVLQPGDPGDRHAVTFDQPGRFRYHCELHSSMSGVVTVVAAPAVPSATARSSEGPSVGSPGPPAPATAPATPSPAAGTPSAFPSATFGPSPSAASPSPSPTSASSPPNAGPGTGAGVDIPVIAVVAVLAAAATLIGLRAVRAR